MRIIKIVPLVIFIAIVFLLWRGLGLHPTEVPSPLINRAAPQMLLPDLLDDKKTVSQKNFLGHITLLNVWASWCESCAAEHDELMKLAAQHIFLVGLDYKDDPATARAWLSEHGNPYQLVAADTAGTAAIDWGVYGTPETFVIDKNGVVRFKYIGAITPSVWERTLQPLLEKLEQS